MSSPRWKSVLVIRKRRPNRSSANTSIRVKKSDNVLSMTTEGGRGGIF
jgi:hypothetical protein